MAVTRQDLERLTVASARAQWNEVMARPPAAKGRRQGLYLPIEQVLAFAAMFMVDPATQGGSDWDRYHPDLRRIGAALRRSPASIANKGANLRGTRAHGQRHEQDLYAALGRGDLPFPDLYVTVLLGAREAGVGADVLPDVLHLIDAPDRWRALFIGDDELVGEDLERAAALQIEVEGGPGPDPNTIASVMADIRVGQTRFARTVLDRFAYRCGFCGLDGQPLVGHRLTVASHVKPWRTATPRERLDPANGIAACPTHDAAFDTGLLTVRDDGTVRQAGKLSRAASADPATASAFAVRRTLQVPSDAYRPDPRYLRWHRAHVWVNRAVDP